MKSIAMFSCFLAMALVFGPMQAFIIPAPMQDMAMQGGALTTLATSASGDALTLMMTPLMLSRTPSCPSVPRTLPNYTHDFITAPLVHTFLNDDNEVQGDHLLSAPTCQAVAWPGLRFNTTEERMAASPPPATWAPPPVPSPITPLDMCVAPTAGAPRGTHAPVSRLDVWAVLEGWTCGRLASWVCARCRLHRGDSSPSSPSTLSPVCRAALWLVAGCCLALLAKVVKTQGPHTPCPTPATTQQEDATTAASGAKKQRKSRKNKGTKAQPTTTATAPPELPAPPHHPAAPPADPTPAPPATLPATPSPAAAPPAGPSPTTPATLSVTPSPFPAPLGVHQGVAQSTLGQQSYGAVCVVTTMIKQQPKTTSTQLADTKQAQTNTPPTTTPTPTQQPKTEAQPTKQQPTAETQPTTTQQPTAKAGPTTTQQPKASKGKGKAKATPQPAPAPPPTRPAHQPVGLPNPRFGCYANAVLQVLLNNKKVQEHFRSQPEPQMCDTSESGTIKKEDWSVMRELQILWKQVSSLPSSLLALRELPRFMTHLNLIKPWFNIMQAQEDVHEFFTSLIHQGEEQAGQGPHQDPQASGFLNTCFNTTVMTKTEYRPCCRCQCTRKATEEHATKASITVDVAPTLQQSLAATLNQTVTVQCETCKASAKVEGRQSSCITSAPGVLALRVVRERWAGGAGRKDTSAVAYPDQLDIQPYMHAGCTDDKNLMYRLYGVIVHHGPFGYGHYHAIVRRDKEQGGSTWFMCNDASVTEVSSKVALSQTKEAVMFFYERDVR